VDDVAIVRVEQFYPFNDALLLALVKRYKAAEQVVWAQEETKNRGGWSFMLPRLLELFPYRKLRYAGREPSASPATGSPRIHREQQAKLVAEALID